MPTGNKRRPHHVYDAGLPEGTAIQARTAPVNLD